MSPAGLTLQVGSGGPCLAGLSTPSFPPGTFWGPSAPIPSTCTLGSIHTSREEPPNISSSPPDPGGLGAPAMPALIRTGGLWPRERVLVASEPWHLQGHRCQVGADQRSAAFAG